MQVQKNKYGRRSHVSISQSVYSGSSTQPSPECWFSYPFLGILESRVDGAELDVAEDDRVRGLLALDVGRDTRGDVAGSAADARLFWVLVCGEGAV